MSELIVRKYDASFHKAHISHWCLEHDIEFNVCKWTPQSPDRNPVQHLWDAMEQEIHIMDVQPTNLQHV